MSIPAPAPTPKPPSGSPLGGLVIPFLLIALAGAVFVFFYFTNPTPSPVDPGKLLDGYVLAPALDAKLAAGYADADGDLLADPPKDGKYADPPELFFTEIPSGDPDADERTWEPFLKHLSAATGKPCKYLKEAGPAPTPEPGDGAAAPPGGKLLSLDAQLEALRTGKLHVTAFTTGQVKRAVNAAGFHPLYSPADKDGKYTYRVEVLVPATSPAKSVADLKGKTLGVPALSSNSGAKAPFVFFHDEFHLNPRTDYQIKVVGGSRAALGRLAKGEIDATCVASDLLARELAVGTVREGQFKRLYQSGEYPRLCFGVPHDLSPALVAKVRNGFESFAFAGTPVGEKYRADGAVRFRPVDYKKDWQAVRDVDDKLVAILTTK